MPCIRKDVPGRISSLPRPHLRSNFFRGRSFHFWPPPRYPTPPPHKYLRGESEKEAMFYHPHDMIEVVRGFFRPLHGAIGTINNVMTAVSNVRFFVRPHP